MQTRRLGMSDLEVSLVGLGCNNFGGRLELSETRKVVFRALDLGVTFFDTADVYGERGGSETQLGGLLKGERQNVVLATKFGLPMKGDGTRQGASARYIREALAASLKRLQTDYVDLYQVHTPDPETPIEETLGVLHELRQAGLVRAIGASNFSAEGLEEAQETAARLGVQGFVSSQDEYSLLKRDLERDLLRVLEEHNLGLLPYFPLASGLLTGKYRTERPEGARLTVSQGAAERTMTARNLKLVEALHAWSEARGRTLLELAFSWLTARPQVASVIAGATRPEQVEANAAAVSWTLSPEELAEIDRMTLEVEDEAEEAEPIL